MRTVRTPCALLLPAIVATWAGCAHVPEIEQGDPSFSFESLEKGGVANIGVVQPGEVLRPPGPDTHALEKVLAIMCPKVPVIPAARARDALGAETVHFVLLSYQMQGVPEEPWLSRAADSLRGVVRYAALARVESNAIRYGQRPTPPPAPTKNAASSDTARVAMEGNVPATMRDIVVRVHLYDLETGRLAFSGSYFGTATSVERDTMPLPQEPLQKPLPSAHGVFGVATVDVIPTDHPLGYGYPAVPPLAHALEAAYLEFVRSLPGIPSGR